MTGASEASMPHDGSYKHLFSHPEMIESLIRDFVPEEWVRELTSPLWRKKTAATSLMTCVNAMMTLSVVVQI
jgi:hypothetical protein